MAYVFKATSCLIIQFIIYHHPQIHLSFQGTINRFLPILVVLWSLCQLLFSLKTNCDAETSQAEVQWHSTFFFVCHNMGAGSQSLWAALSLKQKCSTQVSPIKEQGWLNVWYLLDDWESTTKQTIFLITHCTIFLPHVCFIMAQLFKATLGNTLPLSVWKKSMEARKQNGPIKLCSLPISNYLMQCCSMLEQDVRHFDVCPHWLWLKQQASII